MVSLVLTGTYSKACTLRCLPVSNGKVSTPRYKRYNNPLLLQLENQHTVVQIGNINIPHATCADDVALLSHSQKEMSSMLKSVEDYSNRYRYTINPTKSSVLIYH